MMKRYMIKLLLLALSLCLPFYGRCGALEAPALRIACVGDSLTYGHMVEDRERNSYPAQLAQMLGEGYTVENFGVSGSTLQHSGDYPYWESNMFERSTDFAPDIVLLMLGSNDAAERNWQGTDSFVADYREMVAHYQTLPGNPRVYVLTPPSIYVEKGFYMGKERVAELAQAIRQLAQEDGLPLIDIHTATAGQPELFPEDGLHTNVEGARKIAETVFAVLTGAP